MHHYIGMAPSQPALPMLNGGVVDTSYVAMNLLRYCQPHFLERLEAHYQPEEESNAGFSAAYMALECWVRELYCYSPDAFKNEPQLVEHLMARQEGVKGMLELKHCYSLYALKGMKSIDMTVNAAQRLQKSYPIVPEQTDLVERLGTGNEKSNAMALITWVERQLSTRVLKGESCHIDKLIIPYWNAVGYQDEYQYVLPAE